jgi:hypothetical protein
MWLASHTRLYTKFDIIYRVAGFDHNWTGSNNKLLFYFPHTNEFISFYMKFHSPLFYLEHLIEKPNSDI